MTLTRSPRVTSRCRPSRGEYFHSEHRLYRVEHAYERRVLLEDCTTGELFDVPTSELERLTPTVPRMRVASPPATPKRPATIDGG